MNKQPLPTLHPQQVGKSKGFLVRRFFVIRFFLGRNKEPYETKTLIKNPLTFILSSFFTQSKKMKRIKVYYGRVLLFGIPVEPFQEQPLLSTSL